jgi:hypothetical protein
MHLHLAPLSTCRSVASAAGAAAPPAAEARSTTALASRPTSVCGSHAAAGAAAAAAPAALAAAGRGAGLTGGLPALPLAATSAGRARRALSVGVRKGLPLASGAAAPGAAPLVLSDGFANGLAFRLPSARGTAGAI